MSALYSLSIIDNLKLIIMKKMYLVAISALVGTFAPSLQAQEYADLPKLGDEYKMNVFDASGITLSGKGEDQIWDYSTYTNYTNTFSLKVVDPKLQPEGNSFANADIAIVNNYYGSDGFSSNDHTIHYFKVETGGITKLGRVDKSTGPNPSVVLINAFSTDTETYLKLPLKFGESNTDTWTGDGFVSIGMTVKWVNGKNSYEVDGSGTLKLPGKTVKNVLRIKRTREYVNDNSRLGATQRKRVMYEWYVASIAAPILTIVEEIPEGPTPTSSFEGFVMDAEALNTIVEKDTTKDDATAVNEESFTNSVTTFPNPTIDFLNVRLNGDNSSALKISITDILGKTVYQAKIPSGSGNEIKTIDVRKLDAGIYYLQVEDNERILSNDKIIVGS